MAINPAPPVTGTLPGFETQRLWSDRAIERTTPCLFGIFSLVVIMAKVLHPNELPLRQAEWYEKDEAAFCDVLAAVRRHLWEGPNNSYSSNNDEMILIPRSALFSLLEVACYTV